MPQPSNQPPQPPPDGGAGLLATPRARSEFPRSHGGAWKVAYADFVTALMALFIVLWMMNATDRVKASITGYFRDPRGYTQKRGAGPAGSGEGLSVNQRNVAQIRQHFEAAMSRVPEFAHVRDHVQLSVTGEGLRIDLLETEQGLFFVSGSPEPTAAGDHLLQLLAGEIGKMPNPVVIEGHTDSRPFRNAAPSSGYSNWELSVDRANAARRLLHSHGVRPQQVVEVRGYADQVLLDPANPESPRNRRVSLVVKFMGE
ncbi:MAG TPA: flagellar motor protein MotB [Bryobacteraceae bacterium]|nr:flagellar motor protein MotB [Bryobacteraceae bacterium]